MTAAEKASKTPPQLRPIPSKGDGPWGEAIRYWLARRGMSQAQLKHELNARRAARRHAKRVQAKTISMIVRGFDTQTRLLREIADVLDVPLPRVFISFNSERDVLVKDVVEQVVQQVLGGVPPDPGLDDTAHALLRTVKTTAQRLARARHK